MLMIFQFISIQKYSKLIHLLTSFKNTNRDLLSRLIKSSKLLKLPSINLKRSYDEPENRQTLYGNS